MNTDRHMRILARKWAFERFGQLEMPDTDDKSAYPNKAYTNNNIDYDPTDPRSVAGYKALREIGYV
ncbi:MAG: hypothetical protein HY364_04960 [Candidatus Aenigmarchaeota archaeon]|nr:hypothetical protein [Candidatus Aenigmarchaeota archaeon]